MVTLRGMTQMGRWPDWCRAVDSAPLSRRPGAHVLTLVLPFVAALSLLGAPSVAIAAPGGGAPDQSQQSAVAAAHRERTSPVQPRPTAPELRAVTAADDSG